MWDTHSMQNSLPCGDSVQKQKMSVPKSASASHKRNIILQPFSLERKKSTLERRSILHKLKIQHVKLAREERILPSFTLSSTVGSIMQS